MSLCFATMNHDNLRLNSTHNPENSHISHIFLMKVSKAKLEFRKIVHLAERSEAMVLPLKYDEISVKQRLDSNRI